MAEQEKQSLAWSAKAAFEERLKLDGIKFVSEDGRAIVRVTYSGKFFEAVTFSFLFDDDGTSAALSVYSIADFDRDELTDAWEFCNRVNGKYRWLRFFVDSDRELAATADLTFAHTTAAMTCTELLLRAVATLDAVCGELSE